jgi:hypothetical protein
VSKGQGPRQESLIAENLAPRSVSFSNKPGEKKQPSEQEPAEDGADEIYGRLAFAGPNSGYIAAVGEACPNSGMSALESSFADSVVVRSDLLSPWIHAILFFRTDDSQSPVLEALVPKGRISDDTIANILDHSMPEILNPADGYPKGNADDSGGAGRNDMIEYNYTYRVRSHDEEDDVSTLEGDKFLNCYVAFREVMNPSARAMRRQSLVIVTRWPFPHFAYRLLGKIEEALWHVFTVGNAEADSDPASRSPASQALHVAYGQFLDWPAPAADTALSLPFFGEILQLTLPGSMFAQHQTTTPMAAAGKEAVAVAPHCSAAAAAAAAIEANKQMAPIYAQSNLISVFGPLGLVPYLWGFWELLLTGRDIVVVAERPSLCSEVVIALSTLPHPSGFRGEVWPFVSARGALADDISKMLKEKAQSIDALDAQTAGKKQWNPKEHMELLKTARFSSIIGITNPALLKRFDGVAAVIFASPSPVPWFGLDRYSSRLSASMRVYDASQTFSGKDRGGQGGKGNVSCGDFYLSSYRLWSRGSHRVLSGVDKREVTTLFAVQEEPSSGEQQRITKRLRKLSKKDYLPLGSMMLRDHFSELTRAFHKPLQKQEVPEKLALPAPPPAPAPEARPQSVRLRLQQDMPLLTDGDHRRQEARKWVNSTYDWIQNNRPTAIMNIIVALAIFAYVWLGFPIILVVVGIYFMQIPEKAPKGVEIMLQAIFPKEFLYPNKYRTAPPVRPPADSAAPATTPAPPATGAGAGAGAALAKGVTDFSGVWKRVKTVNFDVFVRAQGGSYVQSKLAASITITHTITMDPPYCDMIRIQEKGGPMDSDKLFTVNGPSQELLQGKKMYEDSFHWSTTEPGVLITKKIHLPERDYEMISNRYLEGTTIRMTYLYREYATKKEVESSAIFERQGPSPNPPPDSTVEHKGDASAAAVGGFRLDPETIEAKGKAAAGGRVNFSGVWSAVRRVNIEAYAGAQGAGYVQRKLAANAPMVHTFTTDEGAANYLGIRIEEKAGPIVQDNSYIINGSKSILVKMKKTYTETAVWEGDTLILRRVHDAGDFEVVLTRKLEDGSDGTPELVLTTLHRDLLTGKETEATIWWHKTGPSPNPPVVVPADVVAADASGGAAPTPAPTSASDAAKGGAAGSDGDTDDSDEEEDEEDDIKMPLSASANKSHFPRALSTAPRADMTGVWKRVETQNYDAFVGAQGAGYVQRKLAASMALQHTIILDPPLFSEFTLKVCMYVCIYLCMYGIYVCVYVCMVCMYVCMYVCIIVIIVIIVCCYKV